MLSKKAEAITIITPDDGSYVTSSFFYVIGRVENPLATHIVVSVNDLKSPMIYIKDPEYISQFKDFFIIDLELEQGENLIGIRAYKDNVIIEEKRIKVNKIGKYDELPKNKKKYAFHNTIREKECLDCHKFDRENCLECHKGIISKKYVHGPAGSGDCDVCHSFSENNGYKYKVKDDIEEICFDCHSNMKKESFKNLHGPYAAGTCDLCHNVHSSDYSHQLLYSVNEVCKICHVEFKQKGKTHVLPKHPLENKKDPSRPGKELSCSSCHNPHGQEGNMFFPQGKKSRMEICGICHKK